MKRKIVFLILLFLYFGVNVCKSPTEPQSSTCSKRTTKDLVLLLSKEHLTNPVVSPDGKIIYFLQSYPIDDPGIKFSFGSIYAINVDGSNYRKILDGWYNALAISNDGKKLAFKINREEDYYPSKDSLIGVLNLGNFKVDTYKVMHHNIRDIEFSLNDEWIYYLAITSTSGMGISKIYKLNILDSTNFFVDSIERIVFGFDLDKNDVPFFSFVSEVLFPQINFKNPDYAIGSTEGDENNNGKLALLNISKNIVIYLPDSCTPYEVVGMPYWFPDGNTIVFFAREWRFDPGGQDPGELWILRNVFKYIK
jgi:hypothetical protein